MDLTSGQNRRLREAMKRAQQELFEGSVTLLAKAIGRAQPSISDFLNGKGGASYVTAMLFATKVVRQDVAEILGPPDEDVPPAPASGARELVVVEDRMHAGLAEFLQTRPDAKPHIVEVLKYERAKGGGEGFNAENYRDTYERLERTLDDTSKLAKHGAYGRPVQTADEEDAEIAADDAARAARVEAVKKSRKT